MSAYFKISSIIIFLCYCDYSAKSKYTKKLFIDCTNLPKIYDIIIQRQSINNIKEKYILYSSNISCSKQKPFNFFLRQLSMCQLKLQLPIKHSNKMRFN